MKQLHKTPGAGRPPGRYDCQLSPALCAPGARSTPNRGVFFVDSERRGAPSLGRADSELSVRSSSLQLLFLRLRTASRLQVAMATPDVVPANNKTGELENSLCSSAACSVRAAVRAGPVGGMSGRRQAGRPGRPHASALQAAGIENAVAFAVGRNTPAAVFEGRSLWPGCHLAG